jgi:hypothetical protein
MAQNIDDVRDLYCTLRCSLSSCRLAKNQQENILFFFSKPSYIVKASSTDLGARNLRKGK